MTFTGFPFLFGFLPLALGGFAICGRLGEAWAKGWLIGVSLLFYGAAAPSFLPLLILSVAGNLLLLQAMPQGDGAGRWAVLGVVANLAVLSWFKYLAPGSLVPLGLSFFTFTQIGCVLHHAAGNEPPPRARDYVLFAAFFPALTAGPILNAGELLPQFARTDGWGVSASNLATGSGFFLVGLLKKTLLADPLSDIVAAGFGHPSHLTLLPAWQAATAYSLQLYFDFSGYSDMAVGLALMFGLRFPDNFDQPYRATSVIDYWRRWHMSLTRFLMANVHAPLTMASLRWRRDHRLPIGHAAQQTPTGFFWMIGAPVLATMVVVSLWHGATLIFLLFGLLHTAFLLVNHLWRLYRAPALPWGASVTLTYLCVLVGAVIFRAPSIPAAGSLLAGMGGLHGVDFAQPGLHAVADVLWLVGLYAIVWGAPSTRQLMQGEGTLSIAWRPSPRWAIVMGGAATLGVLAAGGTGEFLYFQF